VDELAPPGHRHVLVHRDVGEELHRTPVEVDLVDRLVGPGPAQLGRPVGGQDDQRDGGVVGLDDRRVHVDRGRPRRRHHRDVPAGGLRQAERQEAAGALVDAHVQAQPSLGVGLVQREGQWCVS
jgi:hypothetical protein